MDNDWTSDQVRIILKGVLNRILKDKDSFKIKVDGRAVVFSNYTSDSIYISLERSQRVYISLNDHSSFYSASVFPWADKEIKSHMENLLSVADKTGTSSIQMLHKCFPEATSQEFETQVLKVED